ncbi:MAG: hypothetical protein ABFE07_05070 [Armatimonadia bacterium]
MTGTVIRGRALLIALALVPTLVVAAPRRQPVAIRAYINVSSGCQAATVDFLNALKAKYAPDVSLEMIDFGDEGRGLKRWRQSGHRCLTIELNGSPLAKFPYQRKMAAVAFRMPVGFGWSHADLEHAVQAGLRGQLQRATEAEVAAAQRPAKLAATVSEGRVSLQGKSYASVLINGNRALLIPAGSGKSAASKRAAAAATALRAWLARPVKPSDLTISPGSSGWRVLAAGKLVVTATTGDGKVLGRQPQTVATDWLSGIRHALATRAVR